MTGHPSTIALSSVSQATEPHAQAEPTPVSAELPPTDLVASAVVTTRYAPAYHGGASAPETPPDGISGGSLAVFVVVEGSFAPVGNRREHWRARCRRVERELTVVARALGAHRRPPLPVTVELHRVGWNHTDADGLVGALKCPIDAVAQWLGVDDRDRRIHWRLSQGITRSTRQVPRWHGRYWYQVREVAAELRIVVRQWVPDDDHDALRVAPAPSPKRIRPKRIRQSKGP